ncbi:MAG TPA: hypothetical protein PKH93_05805 [Chitinophagales bacterium]|nr:hypothetical protein [Chitinophagales bacterium]
MQNLLQPKASIKLYTALQISKPRITLFLIETHDGNLLRCYVKDTDFMVGDKVSFYLDGSIVFLCHLQDETEEYYTIKKDGRIDIDTNVLRAVCQWTNSQYPQVGKPSRINLKKSESKWILQ